MQACRTPQHRTLSSWDKSICCSRVTHHEPRAILVCHFWIGADKRQVLSLDRLFGHLRTAFSVRVDSQCGCIAPFFHIWDTQQLHFIETRRNRHQLRVQLCITYLRVDNVSTDIETSTAEPSIKQLFTNSRAAIVRSIEVLPSSTSVLAAS